MAKYTWDHIHLRTTDPEGMAKWFEDKLGAAEAQALEPGLNFAGWRSPRIDTVTRRRRYGGKREPHRWPS